MMVPCPHCGSTLKVNDKFAGRKVLCSSCEQSFLIPRAAPAPTPATAGAPAAPRRAAAPAVAAPADARLYLKIAAEKGYLNGAMAEKAQSAYERLAARGPILPAFSEFMVERGFVTADENRLVVVLLNRAQAQKAPAAAAVTTGKSTEFRDCPNCFEAIRTSSKSCRYCGVFLGEMEVSEQCPNCFAAQPAGAKFCKNCGANMKTGLIGDAVRRRCPKCGVLAGGMETICVVCRTPFDRAAATVVAGEVGKRAYQLVYDNRGFIVLGLILLACLWMFRHWSQVSAGVGTQLYGASEAALRKRADDFTAALLHRDLEGLGRMIWADGGPIGAERVKRAWPALLGAPGADDTADEIAITRVNAAETEGSVYADVVVRFAKVEPPKGAPKADPLPGIDGGPLLGMGGLGSKAPATKKVGLTWNWRCYGETWYCVGPLK